MPVPDRGRGRCRQREQPEAVIVGVRDTAAGVDMRDYAKGAGATDPNRECEECDAPDHDASGFMGENMSLFSTTRPNSVNQRTFTFRKSLAFLDFRRDHVAVALLNRTEYAAHRISRPTAICGTCRRAAISSDRPDEQLRRCAPQLAATHGDHLRASRGVVRRGAGNQDQGAGRSGPGVDGNSHRPRPGYCGDLHHSWSDTGIPASAVRLTRQRVVRVVAARPGSAARTAPSGRLPRRRSSATPRAAAGPTRAPATTPGPPGRAPPRRPGRPGRAVRAGPGGGPHLGGGG